MRPRNAFVRSLVEQLLGFVEHNFCLLQTWRVADIDLRIRMPDAIGGV